MLLYNTGPIMLMCLMSCCCRSRGLETVHVTDWSSWPFRSQAQGRCKLQIVFFFSFKERKGGKKTVYQETADMRVFKWVTAALWLCFCFHMLYGLPHSQRHEAGKFRRLWLLACNENKCHDYNTPWHRKAIVKSVNLTKLSPRVSLVRWHHKQTVEKQLVTL